MKTEKAQNHPPKEVSRSLKVPQGSSSFILIGDKGVLFSLHDYGDVWQVVNPDLNKMAFKQPEPTLPRAPKQSQYPRFLPPRSWRITSCRCGREPPVRRSGHVASAGSSPSPAWGVSDSHNTWTRCWGACQG